MKPPADLQTYIKNFLDEGRSTDHIQSELLKQGWDEVAIDEAITAASSAYIEKSLHRNNVIQPPKQSTNHTLFVIVAALLVVGGLGFASLQIYHRSTNKPTVRQTQPALKINDTNYELRLPPDWKSRSSNIKGSGITAFYKTDSNAAETGRLTVYVLPRTADSDASSHVSEQLKGLARNDSAVDTPEVSSLQLGSDTNGEVTKVAIAMPSQPTEKSYYLYLAVNYGNISYNLDYVLTQAEWQASHSEIEKSAQSFRPKSQSFNKRQ